MQALKFPKTTKTVRVIRDGHYAEEEKQLTQAEIQEYRDNLWKEYQAYFELDPANEGEYLIKVLRFSHEGIRQDQLSGLLYTDQYYLAMEYAENGPLIDLVLALHEQE